MSGLIDNPQLTFDDLSSVEIHKEEFGKDKSLPKTPKVIGKGKAEEWVKSLKEKQKAESKVKGQVKLTGGASTAHRLTEFETETPAPWQMTRQEAISEASKPLGSMSIQWGEMRTALASGRRSAESLHKDMVKLAITEGKPVPGEVLRDYPDLQARPAHTEPKPAAAVPVKSEVDVLIENIMERVRASKTVKEAADLNQELNRQSFKHDIPIEKMNKVYALIEATIERLEKEKELKESLTKLMGEIKKEEPKQDIEVTLLNQIKAAKTREELQAMGKDVTAFLDSLPSVTGIRSETDVGMVVSRAYNERLRELIAVQPMTPEETAKTHAWGYKELDAVKFYRDQEIKKYQKNIEYVKRQKKDLDELKAKLDKDPENRDLRWNWRQMRKATETNLGRMPYWEKAVEHYNEPDWIEKNKASYHERYIKEVKLAISKGKPVPAEVIAQHHEFRKAKDARERYEKGWKTSFANVSLAVVESTKETTGVKVKRQDGKPITKPQIEEIVSGLKDIQDVIGNIIPVMKSENITVVHTSGKYPFLSQAGGMYHPTEKSVTMGIAGTNAAAHEIAHFLDDVAKTQIPQTEPKYDLKLIGEASARINDYYGVDRMLSLSKYKTKEEKEDARLLRAHLGSYWRRQEEIFARLVEQYIAFKNQKSSTAYNSIKFFERTPGWWTHEDFLQLLPMVEAELKRKLDLAFKKHGMTQLIKNPLKKEAIVPIILATPVEEIAIGSLILNPEINWHIPKLSKDEEIVWMSPEEFLSKVPHPGLPAHLRIPASRDTNEKYYDSYSLKSIAERIEKGYELNVPFINYTHDAFGWAEHDGRHRALTAMKMGIKSIPVLVIGKPLIKNPGNIIGDKPNPIMKQQLLKLWKQLLGAEDLGDFETFMKEVSDLTYHEAKEKLLKTYGSPKGKEGEKAAKGEAQACDYAMEQCFEGIDEACTTACDDCGIKEACEKKKVEPVHTDIDLTGLIEDKGERTSRLRIASGALKGKTAFRCPGCFRGLTLTEKGLVCGEHGQIPLTGTIQVGRHTLGHALDLRQVGKDKEVTKRAKETYGWFLEEAKEAGFKTVREYYDSLKDKERDSYKEYARLGVGLEEMFSKPAKSEKPASNEYQEINDWLDNADIDTPEGIEKYKSDWQNTYKEKFDRLPKPLQDEVFMRLTGDTQYISDKKKEAEANKMKETAPTKEVKEWFKKAHGIPDYEGIRSDRIGMLTYILNKGEIGFIKDRNEALSMAVALGEDLGYGVPPTPDKLKPDERYKSIEQFYAEKVANETGKEVPIIMGSTVVKPEGLPAVTAPSQEIKREFKPNAGLINKQLAERSHSGTSWDAEKRAVQEIEGFVQYVQEVYEKLKPYAKTEAQKASLIEEMQTFQSGFAQKYNEKLAAQGRTISSFITGGSKFPTRRAEKANAAYDKRFQEMLEWKNRAEKAIIRKLKGEAVEEAGGEVAVLEKKVKDAEKLQEMMVEANKIIRKKAEPGIEGVSKHKQLVTLGFSEKEAAKLLIPDFAGRKGFSYHLANNSAEIRRLKERIAQLQRKEVTESREFEFTGGTILDNQKDDRVQIFFDQKPAQDIISKLKGEGWHWTPSIGAWQRKRTEYALMSANRITGAQAETQFAKPEIAKPELPEVKPVHTEPDAKKPGRFFINMGDEGFQEVKAKPITIKGLEEYDFFIHKTPDGKGYNLTEGRTGLKLLEVKNVQDPQGTAIKKAEEMLASNKKNLDNVIAAQTKKNGLSPRYTDVEVKKPEAEPEKPKGAELKPQIPLHYIDIDLPTGLVRLFGILHNGRIFGEKSAFSLTGVYDLKGWQPLSERDYSVYKQSIGGSGKQAQRGKTIQWFEKNSEEIIKAGEEELAKQEKSKKLYKDVQEATKKAEKEHHLKASSLKPGDVLEWVVDKSLWVITEVKDGVVYARPESEPTRAGGSLGGDPKEGIVKGYKLVSKPEVKPVHAESKKARDVIKPGTDEYYYFGSKVTVKPGDDPELEPTYQGTIIRVLNDGKLIEVRPEGQKEGSFRIPVERVQIDTLMPKAKTEPVHAGTTEPEKSVKEAEKILKIDLDKYDAYEWGTRVKLIEKHPAKGQMPDVLATGHLSDEEYEKVKPVIKGVQQPRKPLKPTAHFVAKPDKFFISAFDIDKDEHSFEEVEGKPVTIKGFEGHDLFVHRTHGAAGFSITEGRSGTSIVRGIKTEKDALQEAEKVLGGVKRTIDKKIAEAVRVAGLSPRYTAVEVKKRVEKPEPKPEPARTEPKVEKAIEKTVVDTFKKLEKIDTDKEAGKITKTEHDIKSIEAVEKAVEKAVEIAKPEPKPEPKPEVKPVRAEPKKPARKPVKEKKFVMTPYGRGVVKRVKGGVLRLTEDDMRADVIILRG